MNAKNLNNLLSTGKIVELPLDTGQRLADRFELLEDYKTGMVGHLLVIRGSAGYVVVEEQDRYRRVLRRFEEKLSALHFIRDRLDAYERMWDGCCCKIDYLR
jgi:hypothetical protein